MFIRMFILRSIFLKSVEVMGMDMLKKRIKNVDIILGDGKKKVTESEIQIRKKLRGE